MIWSLINREKFMLHTFQTVLTKSTKRVGLGMVAVVYAAVMAIAALVPITASAAPNISAIPVGTVLSTAPMTLAAELQPLAIGKKITYISTDIRNEKIVVSGAVITPKKRVAQSNIVAWAHGSTGLADQCAPSKNADVFWPEAVTAVQSYLQNGWTVTATDYAGLGTPGDHPYLMGESGARAVIDSVRAARKLDDRLTKNWVVSGHSQGGQAGLFAGEIADTYGTGLSLKGVVAMSPVSNAEIIASMIAGTPGQGYLVMGLLGLAAIDSAVNVDALLAQPAKDLLPVTQNGCLVEILYAYANLTADELLVGGALPEEVVGKLAAYANPAQQASTVPVLLVQGTADQDVPADLTYYLQYQICAYGTSTYLHVIDADHIMTPIVSVEFVADYISARFAGQPAPSNCM